MATFNYEDKEAINVNPTIPNKNKVVDSDMNLIKQVGNQILTTLGVYTDNWDDEETYLVDDIVVYDNRYFKNLTGTNTATPPTEDTTNWLEVSIRDIGGNIVGDTLPIGAIVPFSGEIAPAGWMLCIGQSLNISDYPELYNVIGLAFGGEEGGTTFNLPNLKGKVVVGKDSSQTEFDTIGETGGNKTDNLSNAYAKVGRATSSLSTISYKAHAGSGATFDRTLQGGGGIDGTVVNASDTSDLGGSVSTLQPYMVTNYIIKVKQTAGLVGAVSDSYSTSHTDTYSCDYINNSLLDVYSETEQVVGTWFGKTLYKMSFQKTGNLSNISTGITDLDEVVDLKVNVKSSSGGQWRTVPWIYNANNYDSTFAGGAYVTSTGATIGFQAGTNLSAATKYNATILYTKTTD